MAAGALGAAKSVLLPQAYSATDYLRSTENGISNTAYFADWGMFGFPRWTGRNHNLGVGNFSQSSATENNYMEGLTVSQFLYDFGRVKGMIDQRKAQLDEAKARLKLTNLNLIFEVNKRYYALLDAHQIVRVYRQAIVQRREHLHQAEVMAKADLKPEVDVYITKADLARAQMHLVQSENAEADAKVGLDNAMGLSGRAPQYYLSTPLSWGPVKEALPDLVKLAFGLRPDLLALEDEARAAGAVITQYRSDFYPTVESMAGYVGMGVGLPVVSNGYVGLQMSWPIFNGFRTVSHIEEAKAQEQTVEHAIQDLEQRVILQVQTALLNWQASVDVIRRAIQTRDASRIELELASKRYVAGLSNVVELDDAQRRYVADDAAYYNALYGYSVAKAETDWATGRALGNY